MVYNVKPLKPTTTQVSQQHFSFSFSFCFLNWPVMEEEGKTHQPGKSSPQDFHVLQNILNNETFFGLNYKQLEFIIQSQTACHFLFMKVWETRSHNSHTGMWGTTA